MPISVIIPAHDEAAVIGRCLSVLLDDADPGELAIVVSCNGCRDRTASIARSFGAPVRVIEIPEASKTAALNAAGGVAGDFPRIYLDADIDLKVDAVRRIADALSCGRALAASPEMDIDLTRSSWPVRAYYEMWQRTPYVREGMIGVGCYALSEAGRRRFDSFPGVIADDGYVRMLFQPGERVVVPGAKARVRAPRSFSDLLRVKIRSRMGQRELKERFPELQRRETGQKRYSAALWAALRDPRVWPSACVYLVLALTTRLVAARRLRTGHRVWERDLSSRVVPNANGAADHTGLD